MLWHAVQTCTAGRGVSSRKYRAERTQKVAPPESRKSEQAENAERREIHSKWKSAEQKV